MALRLSPVETLIKSGARVSGAMQRGLDEIATSDGAFGPLDPVAWILLAGNIIIAAIRISPHSYRIRFAVPGPASGVSKLTTDAIQTSSEPSTELTPVSRYRRPEWSPGWGPNPFRPPAPPPVPNPLPAVQPAVRVEDLQAAIDQDAIFCFYSLPESTSVAIADDDDAHNRNLTGVQLSEVLHRFKVNVSPPTNRAPLAAVYTLGETVGTSSWRWMIMPDDFVLTPGVDPPATKLDPDKPQRFAMLDGLFRFGKGEDGFRGWGAGQTFPAKVRGRKELYVTGTAVATEGFGKFRRIENGVINYSGRISAAGFRGSLMLRVGDSPGELQTFQPLPDPESESSPEHGVTWLTVRAQAVPGSRPKSLELNDGTPGIVYEQDLRLIDIDITTRGPDGIESAQAIRQVVGSVTSRVAFDAKVGSGTANDPVPFAVWRSFSFVDSLGSPVGGFVAESAAGNAVFTDVLGVKGFRFASTGHVVSGTGRFEGMSALISENTLVVLEPYAGSTVFSLRVQDPDGQFFAHAGRWRDIPMTEVAQSI